MNRRKIDPGSPVVVDTQEAGAFGEDVKAADPLARPLAAPPPGREKGGQQAGAILTQSLAKP